MNLKNKKRHLDYISNSQGTKFIVVYLFQYTTDVIIIYLYKERSIGAKKKIKRQINIFIEV